jgi:hypothetical protein
MTREQRVRYELEVGVARGPCLVTQISRSSAKPLRREVPGGCPRASDDLVDSATCETGEPPDLCTLAAACQARMPEFRARGVGVASVKKALGESESRVLFVARVASARGDLRKSTVNVGGARRCDALVGRRPGQAFELPVGNLAGIGRPD